ncbi:hypothetical protein Pelo_944 [Pelomyxa schiedti]|nr:hypothetical protein Pelo_944 [Pelomyxa schiedti]
MSSPSSPGSTAGGGSATTPTATCDAPTTPTTSATATQPQPQPQPTATTTEGKGDGGGGDSESMLACVMSWKDSGRDADTRSRDLTALATAITKATGNLWSVICLTEESQIHVVSAFTTDLNADRFFGGCILGHPDLCVDFYAVTKVTLMELNRLTRAPLPSCQHISATIGSTKGTLSGTSTKPSAVRVEVVAPLDKCELTPAGFERHIPAILAELYPDLYPRPTSTETPKMNDSSSACFADVLPSSELGRWPGGKIPRIIVVDYGRCHYMMPDGSAHIPWLVTNYCYRPRGWNGSGPVVNGAGEETRTDFEESWGFLQTFGYTDKESLKECISACPVRGEVLTRVKYELLVRWLHERLLNHHLHATANVTAAHSTSPSATGCPICCTIALRAMMLSTQRYLKAAKFSVIKALYAAMPELEESLQFSAFQTRIEFLQPGFHPQMRVTLVNYHPTDGVWQVTRPVKPCTVRVRAVFTLALDGSDTGRVTATVGGEENGTGPVESGTNNKFWGVVDCSTGETVPYCDTSPTW